MIGLRPAGNDAHQADLAEANQRAAAAERARRGLPASRGRDQRADAAGRL